MKKLGFIALCALSGCCYQTRCPEYCLPDEFCEQEAVDPNQSDCTLTTWWDNFNDPILSELIEIAMTYNQDLNIAREKICESRALARSSFGILLPQIDATALYTRTKNSEALFQSPFLGTVYTNYYQIGFDAAWEIDLFGKNWDNYSATTYDYNSANATAYDVRVTLASEVGRAYVVVRSLAEQINVLKTYSLALDKIASLSYIRFTGGLDAKQIYLDARALLDQKDAQLAGASESYKQAIYQLGLLLGRAPEEVLGYFCEERPIPQADPVAPKIFPSELLCRRFDVRAAEFMLAASQARVSAARKELFPTVSLAAFYDYATNFYHLLFRPISRNWQVTPQITLPIFHGGRILADIDAATSRQRQAAFTFEKAVLTAVTDVESALVAVAREKERSSVLVDAVQSNQEKTKLEWARFNGGLINLQTLLTAETLLFDYRIQEVQSRESLMVSLITLYKAMGGGWECF